MRRSKASFDIARRKLGYGRSAASLSAAYPPHLTPATMGVTRQSRDDVSRRREVRRGDF